MFKLLCMAVWLIKDNNEWNGIKLEYKIILSSVSVHSIWQFYLMFGTFT
jgi:hypothetical protein